MPEPVDVPPNVQKPVVELPTLGTKVTQVILNGQLRQPKQANLHVTQINATKNQNVRLHLFFENDDLNIKYGSTITKWIISFQFIPQQGSKKIFGKCHFCLC